jgi:hypothetical protein
MEVSVMLLIRQAKFIAFGYALTWVVTCSFLTGCGTIVHGSKQQVSLDSNPQGATVKLTDGTHLTTPQTAELRRAQDHIVTIEKEGYEPERLTINRDFNWGATIFGNILWITPGVIVDVLAGGAWTLNPERINVNLVQEKTKSPSTVSNVNSQ